MDDKENLILVYYISVAKVVVDQIPEYVNRVMERIQSNSLGVGEIIVIPIMGETKIECINPKYITDEELIKKNILLMDQLHERLGMYIKESENG